MAMGLPLGVLAVLIMLKSAIDIKSPFWGHKKAKR